MKVIYSNKYETLIEYEPFVACFEDLFAHKVWDEYPECWRAMAQDGVKAVKCKTRDAILAIPEDVKHEIVRVGRSVLLSSAGQLIVTPVAKEAFLMLEMGPYTPYS